MELYRTLYELSKMLLSEDDPERTAEALLRHVLASTQAERGFIVVREGAGYVQKLHVRYDRNVVSADGRRFSRGLVRQAIDSGELIDSENLMEDPRFSSLESVRRLGPCAVLAVPLRHGGEVYGALYLERPGAGSPFPADARQLVAEFAEIAGLFLRRALEQQALRERSRSLESGLLSRHDFTGIVTAHPRMLELLKTVAQVADSEATALILGETGTGKELIARALHVNSSRNSKPFVTLHCAALPDSVLESELFGHARGAFTGAERERPGRLAAADGGTLFLDEVAETSPEVQAKLLRFLQFGEVQRVGSDRTETLDVRVLAATHRDLPALVKAGRLRQDLYFRLRVIELQIPALRERRSDIPLLLDHFARKYRRRPAEVPRFSVQAEGILSSWDWPGNVRELEHTVQRACVLATGPLLHGDLLPAEMRPAGATGASAYTELNNEELKAAREAAVHEVERKFLTALMRRHSGNVSRAAREGGMQRAYLQRLLAKHRPAEGAQDPAAG